MKIQIFSACALTCLMLSQDTLAGEKTAVFAGGCFWCMQPAFDALDGVTKTVVGYTGGHLANPSYQSVTAGDSGHYESIAIYYDSDKISYQQLLNVFWRNIDPSDDKGQFCDKGASYRAAIFYSDDQQKKLAYNSKDEIQQSGRFKKVVTQILQASTFYPAEEYHQDYYKKNPIRYKYYRYSCGRDNRLKSLWNK